MAWYDEAVFYHIYPLGLCGCAHENDGQPTPGAFAKLEAWAAHAAKLGCTAIYIGPLFESGSHGYDTIDYRLVDRRLGTNEEFKAFVAACHARGQRVIVDGVFNHVGRDFFAFQDLKANRENARYKDWFCDVNFWGNNEYNDGFSYGNWGGYNLLVKLNQRNPEVQQYHYDTVRFWVEQFDIDGIRLDAADVLDFDFMRGLRRLANEVKPEFWLMGEVIHGDYSRWANPEMLHSVTNYELHKGLWSGHNDHNYFEIAHTMRRLQGLCHDTRLYLFSDNHGLNERWPTGIYTAEDSTNFLKVTAPTRYDGVGFDYKWDMGWMHDTLDYFATPFGERPNAYGKIVFSMHYFYNELYLLALSHDEVVHGKKTIIDKLWGTYAEKCAQLRTLYFYMYMHPGKKLNFMGNEMGHFREWDEKRELDWDLLKYPFHDAFQKYFAHLSRVYSTEPALYDGEYNPDCFEWVACESRSEGVYAWLRKGRGENLLCIMNTQDHAHKKFPLYLRFPCSAEEVLNTESPEWGGALKGRRKTKLHTTDGGVFGRDYTLTVDLPAMGSCLLRLAPEAPNPDAARISANKALNAKRRAARSTKAAANSNK